MGAPACSSSASVPWFLLLQLGRKHQPCLPHRFSDQNDDYLPNPTAGKLARRWGLHRHPA